MPVEDMVQEEIFATTPVVPNATPSEAEIAVGFVGGAAQLSFFNRIWFRFSEILFKVQETASLQKITVVAATSDTDTKLLYKDYYIGDSGTDATQRTPVVGNVLTNTGGDAVGKYLLGNNTSVFRTTNDDYPLYTDCGQDADGLVGELQFTARDTSLTAVGDKVVLAFNCTGARERVEVGLVANNFNPPSYTPSIVVYDNLGDPINTFIYPQISATLISNRVLTLISKIGKAAGNRTIEIPEIGFHLETNQNPNIGSSSDNHGFVITPQTFSMNSLLYRTP